MDMVRMETLEERNTLPKTKWNIPQPSEDCQRDEAMETGKSNVLNSNCRFFFNFLFLKHIPENYFLIGLICFSCSGGLDILIIPGRAFTKSGHRLGRGKGYYDKYLSRYKEKFNGKLPYTIGLAYAQQVFDELPVTENDASLDEVIYDVREHSSSM